MSLFVCEDTRLRIQDEDTSRDEVPKTRICVAFVPASSWCAWIGKNLGINTLTLWSLRVDTNKKDGQPFTFTADKTLR